MNLHEFAILEALNIASTIHGHQPIGFEATAAQICEVMVTDERLGDVYERHVLEQSPHQVAARLRLMAGTQGSRWLPFGALCEQHRKGHWRLTNTGARFLGA